MHWGNMAEPVSVNDDISLLTVMGMLVLDCVIYVIITWYIDAVKPGDFGVPQPWYFPVTVSTACTLRRVFGMIDR